MTVHDGMRCVAPLLAAMKLAEEISRDVARRQAGVAGDAALRSALLAQSRQEAVHASAFSTALKRVASQAAPPRGLGQALWACRARLEADLEQGLFDAFPADQVAYWRDATARINEIRTRYG